VLSLFTTCFEVLYYPEYGFSRTDTMRDDNEGVMERGWKTFKRVTKYCIKGEGVYILHNMILVNRENPTLNGVDYHNAVRTDCDRLTALLHWTGRIACVHTGQAVLHAFTLDRPYCMRSHWTGRIACVHTRQLSDFGKNYERNLTEMCSAFWGSSQRLSLWRRDCIQQVRVLLLKGTKMFIAALTKVPYLSSYWSISIRSRPSQHLALLCRRCMRLSSSFSLLKFLYKFHLRSSSCPLLVITPTVSAEQCK